MMGPDASSCLDLDECIIEPDVSDSKQRKKIKMILF